MQRLVIYATVLLSLLQQGAFASLPSSSRYRLEYEVRLKVPRPGAKVRLWVPQPAEGPFQEVHDRSVSSPLPWKLTRDNKFGNQMIFMEGTPTGQELTVSFAYDITRRRNVGLTGDTILKSGPAYDPALFVKGDKKVPLNEVIQKIAKDETKPEQAQHEKIRALFDYVVKVMTYDKSGKGWGQGDAIWACSTKRGNCTDFHSLFNGLTRSVGIPSKFVIGLPIPSDKQESEIPGYHCWAEAYSDVRGWIPLDTSEAKKSGKPDLFYAQLPPDRVEFTTGRDLVLEPRQEGAPLNYFIFPYAEVDGRVLEGVERKIRFKRLPSTT